MKYRVNEAPAAGGPRLVPVCAEIGLPGAHLRSAPSTAQNRHCPEQTLPFGTVTLQTNTDSAWVLHFFAPV